MYVSPESSSHCHSTYPKTVKGTRHFYPIEGRVDPIHEKKDLRIVKGPPKDSWKNHVGLPGPRTCHVSKQCIDEAQYYDSCDNCKHIDSPLKLSVASIIMAQQARAPLPLCLPKWAGLGPLSCNLFIPSLA